MGKLQEALQIILVKSLAMSGSCHFVNLILMVMLLILYFWQNLHSQSDLMLEYRFHWAMFVLGTRL